jgi:hypothetical protein
MHYFSGDRAAVARHLINIIAQMRVGGEKAAQKTFQTFHIQLTNLPINHKAHDTIPGERCGSPSRRCVKETEKSLVLVSVFHTPKKKSCRHQQEEKHIFHANHIVTFP